MTPERAVELLTKAAGDAMASHPNSFSELEQAMSVGAAAIVYFTAVRRMEEAPTADSFERGQNDAWNARMELLEKLGRIGAER